VVVRALALAFRGNREMVFKNLALRPRLGHRLEPSMEPERQLLGQRRCRVRSLKKERIKTQIYKNRDLARHDVADYIDHFYNRTRRHSHLGGVSPEQFEAALKRR